MIFKKLAMIVLFLLQKTVVQKTVVLKAVLVVGNSKLNLGATNKEKNKIFTLNEGKPGHTFRENTNCQIINLVINGVDSSFTAANILKYLEDVLFLSN